MCEYLQILFFLCRVSLYKLYRRLCCLGSHKTCSKFSLLCVGLEGCGKSSILAALSGDDVHKIEPTIGFSIKALMLDDSILDVKELGGGEKVRPYWERYYQNFHGIIFVVKSTASTSEMELAKRHLFKILQHAQLQYLPVLILVNFSDVKTACSQEEVKVSFDLDREVCDSRHWEIHSCNIFNQRELLAIFKSFTKVLNEQKTKHRQSNHQ